MIKKGDIVYLKSIASEDYENGANSIEVIFRNTHMLVDKTLVCDQPEIKKDSFASQGTVVIPFVEKIDSITVKYK